jgi:hypothetical protein
VSTVVVDQTDPAGEASFTSRNLLAYAPGVLLLIAVGFARQVRAGVVEFFYAPRALDNARHQYVLWAIVIGLVVTSTIGLHRIFRAGVQTYEFWLKIGISHWECVSFWVMSSNSAASRWCRSRWT